MRFDDLLKEYHDKLDAGCVLAENVDAELQTAPSEGDKPGPDPVGSGSVEELDGRIDRISEKEDVDESDFDFVEALYAFVSDYHSGQWSPGYKLLSRIVSELKFNPAPSFRGYDSLSEEGKMIYDDLKDKYENKM